jgi:Na+-transporting NADH:ubiquinone oxidoreductase subunit D
LKAPVHIDTSIPAVVKNGIVRDNPVLGQVLGICSALAVTNRMDTTLVMCGALLFVASISCFLVSVLRTITPRTVRMITQMLIIATLVILADLYLKAHHIVLSRRLGPYVGLIITNCIIMGRCEAFASHNPPLKALVDGAANALGYALVLILIALVREPLGSGTILGFSILPEAYMPCRLMIMAPGAFLAMGILVWIVKTINPDIKAGCGECEHGH